MQSFSIMNLLYETRFITTYAKKLLILGSRFLWKMKNVDITIA